ncbi:DUF11 domain-containing protein [Micromonospora jinlongensis]|nr:DUF11 domain-containing protein [Micromonospora jinlongensis]
MRQDSPLPPNGGSPPITNNDQCGRSDAWGRLQEMARDMGLFQGQSAEEAATNQVLTEYTNSPTGAQLPGYQLETDNNTIPAIGGHFYEVSAIFAERNCTVPSAQRARLRFELLLNGVPTVLAENLSPCTDPGAEIINNTWIAQLRSLALQLSVADTPTLGLRLYNATATGIGNDVAFDLPQIVDVTPQLDKAFSPTTIGQGQTSTLTFTITNTNDLQAKNGMSFTDTLPANVTATGVNSTTCSGATVTAPAGATSVDFAGNIDLGVASCMISVQVTSTVVGSYTNTGCVAPDGSTIPGCESNFPTIVGINPPGSATLTVIPTVDLAVVKTGSSSPYVPGAPFSYTVTVTNGGPSDAVGATLTDPLPAPLAGFTWTCTASAGSTCTASGTGSIDDTITVLAGGTVTYTIGGTVPSGTTGDLTNTATLTPPDGVSDPDCTPNCSSTVVTPAALTVDLAVVKTASPSPYVPGAPFSYTVTVTNGGPSDAVGATLTDPLPAPLAGFTWTCTASAGSTCTASGTGNINDTITVLAGGTVTYTIGGTVPSGTTGDLTNTATLTPPDGVSDPECTPNCSSTVVTPAALTVDLAVVKTASPSPYVPGAAFSYTVTVTNGGPSDAVGATLTDPLPAPLAGFTWTCTASAGSTCTASGTGNINDTITVLAGGTVTYTISGTVPSGTTGDLTNTAALTPPPGATDPDCTPNCSSTVVTPAGPVVDLAVVKTASANPYIPGAAFSYTVTVTNGGPSDAVGATLTDPLPAPLAGFTWTCEASTGSTCTASGTGSINDTITVLAGGTVTYTISGTVPSGTTGDLTNTATLTPPDGVTDTDCTPNCSSTVVTPAALTVDLAVVKTASPSPYVPGAPFTYTVTVANGGPSDAVGANLTDPLPAPLAGFTWTCTASAGSTCTASGTGSIDDTITVLAGGTVTYTISGTVPSGITGDLTNTATLTPPEGVTDPDCTPNCSSTVVTPAALTVDLAVVKTASPSRYVPGAPFTYTVTVTNGGPSDAVGANLTDPLPAPLAGFTWTCTASTGSTCTASGTGSINDTITVLAGGTVTYTISGTVPSGITGDLTNTATLTPPGGAIDPDCSPNCSSTAVTPAGPVVDLAVVKTATPNPYVPGTPLTYAVTVTNGGPSDAVGATLTDPLPAPLAGFTWTCAASVGSTCTASGTGSINDTITVLAGGTVTYTISGTVPSGTTGDLSNTATLTPPEGVTDPECTPNCSSTVVTPAALTVDLAVVKTASPSPYVPGAPLTYTVTVTNGGPSDAVGATLTDPLPAPLAGFTWACEASTGSTCTASGTGSINDTITVLAGGTVTYTISGTVPSGTTGDLTNTATLTPPAGASDPECTPTCSSTVVTPAALTVDLAVVKTASPSPYVPGAPFTYTVTVTNGGPSDAVGTNLTDPLPAPLAGFTWTCEASVGSTCTASGTGSINDTITVLAGGTVTYTISGTVPSGTTGDLTNTATLTPPPGAIDPDCTPNCSSTVVTPAGPVVDLAVVKTANPSPYVPGAPFTYTVTVTNGGPSDAVGANLTDPLPAPLSEFSWTCAASTGSTCTASGTGNINDTITVLAGGTVTYTISGTVPSGTTGDLSNTATLTPPAGASDPECTPSCSSTVVTPAALTVDLAVVKTASPSPYVPGTPFTYTVTVTNGGPSDAVGANLTDPLPAPLAGFTWACEASAGSTCTASGTGNINDTITVLAGGTVTYTISGTVPSGTTGDLTNTATLTPPEGVTDPDCTPTCSSTVVTPAALTVDLAVVKTASPSPYVPGTPFTYTVTVTNGGPSDAVGATLTDPLPAPLAGFTWTCEASAGSTCTASGTGSINDTITVLAGGTVTYTISGTVPSGTTGDLSNTATLTPPPGTIDPDCTPNCSSTVVTPAAPTVDLTVTKTATPSPYVPGTSLTYTVTVTNGGPSDAVGANLTDPLPAPLAGFTWTCAASAGSTCTASGTGDINDTITVLAGGTVTYTISGTVPSGTTGDLSNTATLTPPGGAIDPDCNPSCSSTVVTPAALTVDLAVVKTASPSPYVPGTPFNYTVTVTNGGPSDAVGANLTDPLPAPLAGFTWTCEASTGSTCTASGTGSINDTITVLAGGTVTYTISGTVPPETAGDLTNTATLTPPEGATDPDCTPTCSSTVVTPAAPTVGLAVVKTATPSPYVPGAPLTFTVTVTNRGPSDAIGANLTDPLPAPLAGFTWTCAASTGSSCTASGTGSINDTITVLAGGTVTYTISGTVPKGTAGDLTNTATLTPPDGVTDPDCTPNCSSTVVLTGPIPPMPVTGGRLTAIAALGASVAALGVLLVGGLALIRLRTRREP